MKTSLFSTCFLCMRFHLFILFAATLYFVSAKNASAQSSPYTFRAGDPYGTGKWYMGREIAHVMGHRAMDWLDRPERQQEERSDKLIRNLKLEAGYTVADIGAGSGYHSFRMAAEADQGKIYAVDIQDEMLREISARAAARDVHNVFPVKGTATGFELPPGAPPADRVLMVDVYHEFSHPKEMMESVKDIMHPEGLLYLVEYRLESKWVPIKKVHKMSEEQAVKEMEAAGFTLVKNMGNLPWQHCMVFKLTDPR